jgi:hypothetical protein
MLRPGNDQYENSVIFKTVEPEKLISWSRLSDPLFDIEVGLESINDLSSNISFKMILKSSELYGIFKRFVYPKNEEHFDRLEKELNS